jgi:alpha-tubulin suppressor-like RCC1 family protein
VEALRGVDVASVVAGLTYALSLTYTGDVYSWSNRWVNNKWLPIGHGMPLEGDTTRGTWAFTPLPRRIEALRGVRVRSIAAGDVTSCAITDLGHLYSWGYGGHGSLGHMTFWDEPLPTRVEALYDDDIFVVGVSAGHEHTLVADADGAV